MLNARNAGTSRLGVAGNSTFPRRVRCYGLICLLGVHAALLVYSAVVHSPTTDEPMHLVAGVWRWQTGRFDLDIGNASLIGLIAGAPVTLADPNTNWGRHPDAFAVGDDFVLANGSRILWLTTIGRCALIPISVFGGFVCFLWARDLYGTRAAFAALALWCFSPDILGNAPLIVGDITATVATVTASYVFWRWLNGPTWQRTLVTGIALGFALLAKFVCIVLFPTGIVLWLIDLVAKSGPFSSRGFIRGSVQLAFVALVSLFIVNLGYACEGSFEPLPANAFQNANPARDNGLVQHSPDQAAVLWRRLPIPLPANYVRGALSVGALSKQPFRPTYFAGEWRFGGWWYYYLYALMVKIPMGTWSLVPLGVIFRIHRGMHPVCLVDECCLLIPIGCIVVFVSMATSMQYARYTLPALPFVLLWVSAGSNMLGGRHWILQGWLILGLAWSIFSSMAVYPHELSYFNELAGGPTHGHECLLDSSMDLGQDLFFLKHWLDGHPEVTPLHLKCLSVVPPHLAGIAFQPVPPVDPVPGWHALSVTYLHADAGPDKAHAEFAYFRKLKPVAMAGYSIYIYNVTIDDAKRLRAEVGLPRLPDADSSVDNR